MMHGHMNIMRREAERAMGQKADARYGIVSSYDPNNYAAKVRIQPEDTETGWLPIATPWSGNGWGMFCPPSIGDVVDITFQEGGKEAGFVCLRHFGDRFRPLPVPSGEFWLEHAAGSRFRFHNDGTVEFHAAAAINSSAPVWNHTGNFILNGYMRATGDIWDNYLTGGYTMASFRATYDIHTHSNVQNGPGHTAIPDQIL